MALSRRAEAETYQETTAMRLDEIRWNSIRVPIITGHGPLVFNDLILHDAMVLGAYVDFDAVNYWRANSVTTKPIPERFFTTGWKCRQCKTTFFGADIWDLEHSCTGKL